MTNEEKLRSLLAEVRGYLCDVEPLLGEGGVEMCGIIDAALAEPVSECCGWKEQFNRVVTERNAAQAQREKARAYANKLAGALAEGALPKDLEVLRAANTTMAQELHEARAEVAAAYQRGAEAMRGAAAGTAYTTLSLHDSTCRRSELRQAVVDAIEALPLPEDKQ